MSKEEIIKKIEKSIERLEWAVNTLRNQVPTIENLLAQIKAEDALVNAYGYLLYDEDKKVDTNQQFDQFLKIICEEGGDE